MKKVFLLISAVIICIGGCYKEPQEDQAIAARPTMQERYANELYVKAPDYGESLEQKRSEFAEKLQEIKQSLKVWRVQQRIDTLQVARPPIY